MAGARLSSGAFHSDASAGWHGFSLWCLKKASSPVLRYTILAGALLLVMVLATFPYTETISAFLAPIDLEIISERQTIAFPFGAELHNVNLVLLAMASPCSALPKLRCHLRSFGFFSASFVSDFTPMCSAGSWTPRFAEKFRTRS